MVRRATPTEATSGIQKKNWWLLLKQNRQKKWSFFFWAPSISIMGCKRLKTAKEFSALHTYWSITYWSRNDFFVVDSNIFNLNLWQVLIENKPLWTQKHFIMACKQSLLHTFWLYTAYILVKACPFSLGFSRSTSGKSELKCVEVNTGNFIISVTGFELQVN